MRIGKKALKEWRFYEKNQIDFGDTMCLFDSRN